MENSDCDFVETTERGNYCCLKHCACTVEKCEVLKYGLGKEDLEIAAEDMMLLKANMNRQEIIMNVLEKILEVLVG